jgi:hypothetical protein
MILRAVPRKTFHNMVVAAVVPPFLAADPPSVTVET